MKQAYTLKGMGGLKLVPRMFKMGRWRVLGHTAGVYQLVNGSTGQVVKVTKCSTPSCKNARLIGKGQKSICWSCYNKAHKNMVRYKLLRLSADRRNKTFNLTVKEWEDFCRTHPCDEIGRRHDKLSVDRIDELGGYSADNIQLLTMGENAAKKARFYGA